MTKKFIINAEQIDAHRESARLCNPNRAKIEELKAQANAIWAQISPLISEDEKYYNLMMGLATFDEKEAAVKCMENNELCEHLANLFFDKTEGELDEAILSEALERLGYNTEPPEV